MLSALSLVPASAWLNIFFALSLIPNTDQRAPPNDQYDTGQIIHKLENELDIARKTNNKLRAQIISLRATQALNPQHVYIADDHASPLRWTACTDTDVLENIPFIATNAHAVQELSQDGRGNVPMLRSLYSRNEFPTLLNAMNLTNNAVELGVHRGEFAKNFLENWWGHKLYLVDAWETIDNYTPERGYARNQDLEATKENLRDLGGRYEIVQNFTYHAVHLYPNDFFDFIYLDATHLYPDVRRDLNDWWPKLKVGGLFAGHDYWNGFQPVAKYTFGVKDAVDEFAATFHHRVYVTHPQSTVTNNEVTQSWYILKCAQHPQKQKQNSEECQKSCVCA